MEIEALVVVENWFYHVQSNVLKGIVVGSRVESRDHFV